MYSVDGLMERLIVAGFEVVSHHFESQENDRQGMAQNENILLATKK